MHELRKLVSTRQININPGTIPTHQFFPLFESHVVSVDSKFDRNTFFDTIVMLSMIKNVRRLDEGNQVNCKQRMGEAFIDKANTLCDRQSV